MSSLASQCFETAEERRENLPRLRALPLEDKVIYSKARIMDFYVRRRGKVYVAYSGGKDSTVLLHLVRSLYPDVPAGFIDTGLELPEIRSQALNTPGVVRLRPEMSFRKVIQTYGYPCIGKVAAHWISLAQRGQPSGIRQMSSDGKYGYSQFAYMVDAPFRVSERCCDIMKKRPSKQYHRETGRCPYLGMHADESTLREDIWVKNGENVESTKIPSSTPLSIWTDRDIWDYIHANGLSYPSVYDMGYERTGCMFCCFGITRHPDRFLRLKQTHPKQWAYCMRPIDEGGLGLREVLDYMHIPTGCEQSALTDYGEVYE